MKRTTIALSLPLAAAFEGLAQETVTTIEQQISTEVNPSANEQSAQESHTNGLIGDLAWILILAAFVTLLFKKLKQPVILGYIIAGFIASPKFIYLPSISNLENIEFWADLGIVVLMFSIGLEFSFKKLMNAGSSAVITALVIITGMTFAGFGVGFLLKLNPINCIFLGGMISMSSTTIIMKALDDLGLKQKKFASLVLAVLIIEDLFAVLMLVLLSSLAMGNVQGMELLFCILKLVFFLIIWFVVGVYLLPTFLMKMRSYLNDESMLVFSMALCFGMAIFSVLCGFSLELGAFVMGSILAGTLSAEHIERVIKPVKDLFGSVFFISVGMMVEPGVIATYWGEILLLAAVVVIGMIIFGTLGMLLTGQNLKVAMESGFTLTQIGEFSFIIASLGMSLGVLEKSIYPIIVAVSVITIFTTPYFIKMADGAYKFTVKHLPGKLTFLINRYSQQGSDANETKKLWKAILSRYLWRIVLYSVVILGIILLSQQLLFPFLRECFEQWGNLIATAITFIAMLPFLVALSLSSTKPDERIRLHATASFVDVPLVAMRIVRYIVTLFFLVYYFSITLGPTIGWIIGIISFVVIVVLISTNVLRQTRMEDRFMNNLNFRENTRLGVNNNLVDDMHQAYIKVGTYCPFVGDKLKHSGLRSKYGISVSSIQRGELIMPLPSKDTRIFPGDVLGVIGSDDEIKKLNDDLAQAEEAKRRQPVNNPKVELKSIRLTSKSPIIDMPLGDTDLQHDYASMIVKVLSAGDGEYKQPTPDLVLKEGDTVWVVGDSSQFDRMK